MLSRVSGGAFANEPSRLEFNVGNLTAINAAPPHVANRGKIVPLHEQRYVCGECGKGYKWMDNLRRHQRLECGGKLPKFRCNFCMKMFYRRYELTNHMYTKHYVQPISRTTDPDNFQRYRFQKIVHWNVHFLEEAYQIYRFLAVILGHSPFDSLYVKRSRSSESKESIFTFSLVKKKYMKM